MDVKFQDHFTLQGRLNRLGFLYSFLFIVLISIVISYASIKYHQSTGDTSLQFIIIKSISSIMVLAIWTPFIVRRLHDIGLSGWFSVLFWVTAPFEDRNVAIAQIIARHPLDTLTSVSDIVKIIMSLVILLLFVTPGAYWPNKYNNPNNALKRDSAKNAAPLS